MSEKLIGKTVRSECGIPIGVIKKSLTDTSSGKIISLLLTPSSEVDSKEYHLTEQGDIVLPYQDIAPVKDALVFEDTLEYGL